RFDTDPPGLAPSTLLKEGEGNYVVTGGGTRNRWGDYMGIGADPGDPNVIWSMVEYAAGTNTWGTWVGSYTHSYTASGIVQDAVTGAPIPFADVEINETGRTIVTDSVGFYSFGS
ncbi:MAG: hypothetical protein GWN00_10400, partial [Aliifodinibius sp.]|nr:carboxypeptidase-like regulatory domain-containing protein [Fodinibius sp.]NIW44596.1 hypothetical protein [Gammaproteobacteria bacterium]NIX02737.1 hypothetical protein [Phycisphaerae bacterium]NIY25200.1 hypothetical protein [Fodinibius sp.]